MPKHSRSFVALGLALASAASSAAVYVDLPIADARDHAFVGDTLYVTADTRLHRYDLKRCTPLPPIALDSPPAGIDASANGRWIAVAGQGVSADKAHFYLIDRDDGGTPRKIEFPAAFYESGTYMVAWTAGDVLSITSSFAGSGWVPLRRYDPHTGAIDQVRGVRQDSMIAASGDGALLALAESNISSGPAFLWNPDAAQYAGGIDLYWFVFEIAADDTANRVVVPTYGGAHVLSRDGRNGALAQVGTIGQYASWGPLSVVAPPGGTQFVTADWDWNGTRQGVNIYSARTLALQKRVDNYPFPWSGNGALSQGRLTLSRDTRWLAATIAGGVRLYDLANEPIDRIREPGTPPVTTSCGTPHALDAAPPPQDARRFDADGWEVGKRPVDTLGAPLNNFD